MLGSIFNKKAARKSTSTSANQEKTGSLPQFEVLEDRVVMTLPTGIGISPPPTILPFSPPSQFVNLTTEPHDQVAGLMTAKTNQFYSFQLQEGDYLQSDLAVEPGPAGRRRAPDERLERQRRQI